jgi:hypothetical protein
MEYVGREVSWETDLWGTNRVSHCIAHRGSAGPVWSSCVGRLRVCGNRSVLREQMLALNAEAVQAYVEWVPLGRLGPSGLLGACAYLLTVPEQRMGACGVLRQISVRKQLQVRLAPQCVCHISNPLCILPVSRVNMATDLIGKRVHTPSICSACLHLSWCLQAALFQARRGA